MKTNTEISFSFWLTLFYSIPLLALTHRQTDRQTDRQTENELILVVLAEPEEIGSSRLTEKLTQPHNCIVH